MITPAEIKKQAERWYRAYLAAIVEGYPFFPKDIRFGKVKASATLADYGRIRGGIVELDRHSSERLGYGYSVEFMTRKDRKTGMQRFPQRIWFPGEEDYLRFIEKEQEAGIFKRDAQEIITAMPQLRGWVLVNPFKIIEHAGKWRDLCAVCAYFIANPRPNLYVRELPLELPTKFVEENKAVLRQLLDVLVPEHINGGETEFEKRFHLRYDEPLIMRKKPLPSSGKAFSSAFSRTSPGLPASRSSTGATSTRTASRCCRGFAPVFHRHGRS